METIVEIFWQNKNHIDKSSKHYLAYIIVSRYNFVSQHEECSTFYGFKIEVIYNVLTIIVIKYSQMKNISDWTMKYVQGILRILSVHLCLKNTC